MLLQENTPHFFVEGFSHPELETLANRYIQVTCTWDKTQWYICQTFAGSYHRIVKTYSHIYRPWDSECIYSEEQEQFTEQCQTKKLQKTHLSAGNWDQWWVQRVNPKISHCSSLLASGHPSPATKLSKWTSCMLDAPYGVASPVSFNETHLWQLKVMFTLEDIRYA